MATEKKTNILKEWAAFAKKPSTQKTYSFGDNQSITVTIKAELSFAEHMAFESDAKEMALLRDFQDIEDYQPSLQDFAIQCAVVSYYTDLNLDTDTESLWTIINDTTLYNDILEYADKDVLNSIGCICRIYDMRKRYIATNNNYNKLLSKISSFIDKLNIDISEDKLKDILGAFKNMSGISQEKIVETLIKTEKKAEASKASSTTGTKKKVQ